MARYRSSGYRGGGARSSAYRGGSSRNYGTSSRSTSSASGAKGKSGGRTYSANTRSFVAGKIAGQYQAKGYSKAHAQHIGNKVVGKAGSTFRPGNGSRQSWTAGVVTGRNQGLYGYGQRRSTYIGNAVVRKQALRRSESVQQSAPLVQARTSKLVNSLARSESLLRSSPAPRQLRSLSKRKLQTPSRISSSTGARKLIGIRSKILGFDNNRPLTDRPATSSLPDSSPPKSKIVGWGEGVNVQQVSSKIVRFAGASVGASSNEATEASAGGEASESR